ncbi:MAG: CPXCG motif-containing cysteine-rich protein [Pirellulales bacterium]|jgi:transcription elongation factor Elf1|nr:CPXCG motif-containing cysteine-rich protein [Pirellulales bacterium]
MQSDTSYTCPSCGEEIVIPVDFSQGSRQEYVEDCPVCCHPSVIRVEIDEDANAHASAEPEQDYE